MGTTQDCIKKTPQLGRFSFGLLPVLFAGICLILSWLMPLHFPPWVSWHSELLSFFAVFFLSGYAVFSSAENGKLRSIRMPIAVLPFCLLAAIVIIQVAMGQQSLRDNALVVLLYLSLCILSIWLGYIAVHPYRVNETSVEPLLYANRAFILQGLATVILLGSFISAVISVVQALDVWESATWITRMPTLRRPGGNLGQPNHLATLLVMGVVSLVFLYEAGLLKNVSALLIYLILAVGLAATESRTGILSALIVFSWWGIKRKNVKFTLPPLVVGLAGALLGTLFWVWPYIFEAIHLMNSGVGISTSAGGRLVVWPQLMAAISLRPWWGWGVGRVSEAHNSVAHVYPSSEPFTYSHNIVLDLMIWVGIPITILLVLGIGIWIWRRMTATENRLTWYCIALALPFATHSMLEFPFAYAYFLVPIMFGIGILEAIQGRGRVLMIRLIPARVIVLILAMLSAGSAVEYVSIEEDFRIARFEAMRIGQTSSEYQRPTVVLLGQLGTLLEGARLLPRPQMNLEELALAKEMALRYPWTATQNRYALSLALNGNPGEALRQLQVMRAMHGEKKYRAIKENWSTLAQDKYPQLRDFKLP